jgi:hypothetical protein
MKALLVAAVSLLAVTAIGTTEAGERSSRFETEVFHYTGTYVGDERTDFSGMEIRWVAWTPRWTVRLGVPGVIVSGPPAVTAIGPGFAVYRKSEGRGQGSGDGGTGGGQGGRGGTLVAQTVDASVGGDERNGGVGDLRAHLTRRMGRNRPWGRLSLLAGLKLPTADEARGLGTGETDAWAGMAWKREGWRANLHAYMEWVHLGDPPDAVLRDGPAVGAFIEWPFGRGGVETGIEGARSPIPGEETRISLSLSFFGPAGDKLGWKVAALAGVSDTAPDIGLTASLRFP